MANRNIENLICEKFGSKVIYRSKDHNKRNKRMGHDYDNDKLKWYNYTEPKNYLILLKNGMVIEVMQKSIAKNAKKIHVMSNLIIFINLQKI